MQHLCKRRLGTKPSRTWPSRNEIEFKSCESSWFKLDFPAGLYWCCLFSKHDVWNSIKMMEVGGQFSDSFRSVVHYVWYSMQASGFVTVTGSRWWREAVADWRDVCRVLSTWGCIRYRLQWRHMRPQSIRSLYYRDWWEENSTGFIIDRWNF